MPNSYNRHGTKQEVHVREFTRDRTGVVTGVVERHLKEDSSEDISLTTLRKTAAPSMSGIPCVNVTRGWVAGFGIYKFSYEGFDDGFEPDDSDTTYELDISLSEDAIETFVNFAALRDEFGWNPTKRQFAELYTPGGKSGAALSKTADPLIALAQQKRSPLYGTDSYLAVSAHYSVTYARKKVPASSVALTNCIVTEPRGMKLFELPEWAKKRNWLCLGPRVTHRGNVAQIAESYLLSGPRGWLTQIYGADKMGATSAGQSSGGGLVIDTLKGASL